jgi:hypothetical protein
MPNGLTRLIQFLAHPTFLLEWLFGTPTYRQPNTLPIECWPTHWLTNRRRNGTFTDSLADPLTHWPTGPLALAGIH